jgi:hypothetical protein
MATENIAQKVVLEFDYYNTHYAGYAKPVSSSCIDNICFEHELFLNGKDMGIIYSYRDQWYLQSIKDQALVNKIGEMIVLWYE